MTFATLAVSALTLGFLHGLGADHLVAIAALSVDGRGAAGREARVLGTAVRFACGHAVLLGVGAAALLTFGWVLPAAFESSAEFAGGLLLIALGAIGIWTINSGRAYGHIHGVRGSERWHVHVGPPGTHPPAGHRASMLPTLMGAVFAVSGLRALMMLAPFGQDVHGMSLPLLLALVVIFGAGILLSMSLFGVVLARVWSMRAVEGLGRSAGLVVALASIGLGAYWIGVI